MQDPGDATDRSDLELLDCIALGGAASDAAFRTLVGRYEARVYGMALKMLKDPAEAQDAFQDTFLTVFRKAEGFRREARFSTWLYRVAANHCLMRLRKRSRRPVADLPRVRRPSTPRTRGPWPTRRSTPRRGWRCSVRPSTACRSPTGRPSCCATSRG